MVVLFKNEGYKNGVDGFLLNMSLLSNVLCEYARLAGLQLYLLLEMKAWCKTESLDLFLQTQASRVMLIGSRQ